MRQSFAEHGVSGLFDVSNYFGINPSEELEFMVSSLYYTSVLDFMETSYANEGDVGLTNMRDTHGLVCSAAGLVGATTLLYIGVKKKGEVGCAGAS